MLPKSKILTQSPLLTDFHQVAKVRPEVPVVKLPTLMYWLLAAESSSWLLETTAPFIRVAS
jgi:hypothetical protein